MAPTKKINAVAGLVVATMGLGSVLGNVANAQDLEPRSFTNVPIGQTFLVLGAVRSEGDLTPTPGSALQDAKLTIDAAALGLAHSFALGGDSAKIDMAVSRVCYEGSATFRGVPTDGRRCEYGDPKMRLSWNFYGAPALDLKQFSQWDPGLVVGASLQVSIPVGTYNSEHLLNAGANRWMVRPGVGMSYHTGRWHYDLMASVRFFEDNDDYFGGITVEQDPLYSVQGHLVYYLNKGRWLSLNGNYFRGGETTKGGRDSGDLQANSRWGVTFSTPVTPHQSLKFYVNTGVVTRIGNDFDTYGIAWQYRF